MSTRRGSTRRSSKGETWAFSSPNWGRTSRRTEKILKNLSSESVGELFATPRDSSKGTLGESLMEGQGSAVDGDRNGNGHGKANPNEEEFRPDYVADPFDVWGSARAARDGGAEAEAEVKAGAMKNSIGEESKDAVQVHDAYDPMRTIVPPSLAEQQQQQQRGQQLQNGTGRGTTTRRLSSASGESMKPI